MDHIGPFLSKRIARKKTNTAKPTAYAILPNNAGLPAIIQIFEINEIDSGKNNQIPITIRTNSNGMILKMFFTVSFPVFDCYFYLPGKIFLCASSIIRPR